MFRMDVGKTFWHSQVRLSLLRTSFAFFVSDDSAALCMILSVLARMRFNCAWNFLYAAEASVIWNELYSRFLTYDTPCHD